LKEARTKITARVSKSKAILLDPSLTVREWLVRLKKDTAPSEGYMAVKITEIYTEALKPLRGRTLSQWLDRWEEVMKQGIRYRIPQTHQGYWLRDLAKVIEPISETFYVQLFTSADNPEKAQVSEYMAVARELRQALGTRKMVAAIHTARGGAYTVSFAGEEAPELALETSSTGGSAGGLQADSQGPGRKRSATRSQGSRPTKKSAVECPACGVKERDLPDCWTVFEDKRPEGAQKPSENRLKKVRERLEKDEELRRRVEALSTTDEA